MFDANRAAQEEPPPQRQEAERRAHELRDALSLARLQLDVIRRRIARDGEEARDLDGGLERIRASINRALGILMDEPPDVTRRLAPSHRMDD